MKRVYNVISFQKSMEKKLSHILGERGRGGGEDAPEKRHELIVCTYPCKEFHSD